MDGRVEPGHDERRTRLRTPSARSPFARAPSVRGLRAALLALGVAVGLPALAPAAHAEKNLTAVLESEVVFLDPSSTTANITRTFGYLVYDTLFAMNGKGEIKPQMVRDWSTSADKLTWTFTLRDGLKFHDGQPVTATDVVASLRRWGPKDALGRMLMADTQSLEAKDDKTVVLTLKEPFPLVLETLGKPNALVPFIMPARLANSTDKLTEIDGSGPFIFQKDQWRTGDQMVLTRNPAYVPRDEPPDFLAGGKQVKIDKLTIKTMDNITGAQALRAGEIDYLQYVPFDLIGQLERDKSLKLMALGGLDMYQGNYRVNTQFPPFDDPAIRRVLWKLVDQKSVLQAIGIPPAYRLDYCSSFWMCGTPLETNAGSEIAKYSIEDARAALKKTSYKGQPVVIMELPNSSTSMNAALVLVDAMRQAGFTVDEQAMDWGTLLQRRAKKEGWSIFAVYSNGVDMSSPLTHFYAAANCIDYPGWSCDPRVTPLLKAFAKAETLDERKKIAAEIQTFDYDSVPSVMWGQFTVPAAYRTTLSGMIQSSFPIFWGVDKPEK
ncbi:MAG: ABC transporter substrate-binding protein [Rhodospirillales bacterium]|nr:ABC transporter substrate-binding protein [Rhodospirillales bacterium]